MADENVVRENIVTVAAMCVQLEVRMELWSDVGGPPKVRRRTRSVCAKK